MRGESGPPTGWAANARQVRAAGPGPQAQELRRAYLDLLKLCLCDLVGAETTSVEGLPGGGVAARELRGDQLELRVEGRDWPLHGLTMCGLRRLDDLQSCVESIVTDRIAGDLIEVGTWRGGASILMRATLDALGDEKRTVWLADSFQGFPGPRPDSGPATGYPLTVEPYLGAFDFLAAPLEEVRDSLARLGCQRGTRFVAGFFDDTLPALGARRWSLVRLDADTYDSTLLALDGLYPGLAVGGYLVVDDYYALEECRVAVDGFRDAHGIDEPLEDVDSSCVRWRRRHEAIHPPGRPARRLKGGPGREVRSVPRPPGREVPTLRELELEAQLEELRRRVAAVRLDLDRAEELERRLQEVTSSRSWRVTKPFRELNLRRKRRGPG